MSPPVPHGNVVEYISDRLYWACYTSTPTSATPFPPQVIPDPYKLIAPEVVRPGSRSPAKRKPNQIINSSGLKPVYFTVDDALLYNAFHHDFGPLHIGHLYRFAVTLHDILGDSKNEGRVVVFWSKPDGKARANAGCLLACYMVLVQSWPPHLALSPLAMCDPPLMPFRDAGYSQADFILNVQDIVYGVWKAQEKGLVNLREFCLDEYEKYERVDMGDFNWVSPNFLAFASPQHKPPPPGQKQPVLPSEEEDIYNCAIPTPFKNVLLHFYQRDIGLVVRLNSPLYPAEYFTSLGITHMDMIFDDGTCPPLNLVRKFVNIAHQTITIHNKNIAVHCKAGLGRTGCLIGAYLIYRYGFSANEVIAYMRFMRPGMVVGPQQHWLHLNQDEFRKWWFEDTILAAALEKATSQSIIIRTPTKGKRVSSALTPSRRAILGEVDSNHSDAQSAALPAPTPGQPRKTSSRFASAASARRVPSEVYDSSLVPVANENDANASPVRRRRSAATKVDEEDLARAIESGMTEEEYMIRLHRRSSAKGPGKQRTATTTTITTTTVSHTVAATAAATAEKSRNGNGLLGTKIRSSPRRQAAAAGVRKTSGRQVSGGAAGTTPPRRGL